MRKPRRTEGYEQFELRLSGAIDSSAFPPVPATISMMYIKDLTNSPGSEYDPSSDQPVQSPPNKALSATGEEGEYKSLCSPSSLSGPTFLFDPISTAPL